MRLVFFLSVAFLLFAGCVQAGTINVEPHAPNLSFPLKDVLVNSYGLPSDNDLDADRIPNEVEVNELHSDPNNSDTDNDGLTDSKELEFGADILTADTDSDAIPDGVEMFNQFIITGYPEFEMFGIGQGNLSRRVHFSNEVNNVFVAQIPNHVAKVMFHVRMSDEAAIDFIVVRIKYGLFDLGRALPQNLTVIYNDNVTNSLQLIKHQGVNLQEGYVWAELPKQTGSSVDYVIVDRDTQEYRDNAPYFD